MSDFSPDVLAKALAMVVVLWIVQWVVKFFKRKTDTSAEGAQETEQQHSPTEQTKAMMNRKIMIMALMAGIVLGAAAIEGFNLYLQSRRNFQESSDSRIFQERLRCKAVADAYVKENSTDLKENPDDLNAVVLTLGMVDYSPARNSCVAQVERASYFRGGALVIESVQDLLSGATLFSVNCLNGCNEMMGLMFVGPAFDYVMKNAYDPHDNYLLDLEKRAWNVEHPPGSAATSRH